MNDADYENEEKRLCEFLDKFDLIEYINKFRGKSVRDLMNYLENNLDYKLEFPMSLFGTIGAYTFSEYLKEKYGTDIYEVPTLG